MEVDPGALMTRLSWLVVPFAAALVLVGLVPPAPAQNRGANGVVTWIDEGIWSGSFLYGRSGDGCCSIYGSPQMFPEQAVWAPDGRTVAVVADLHTVTSDPELRDLLIYDTVTETLRTIGLADRLSRPSFSPDGRRLAIGYGGDIVIVDVVTGVRLRSLTSTAAEEKDTSWSSDGDSIAYAAPDGVWIASASGAFAAHLFKAGASRADFSPDGTRLAYEVPSSFFSRVMIANVDGSAVTDTTLDAMGEVTWSPDGTRFATVNTDGEIVITTLEGAVLDRQGGSGARSLSWQPVQAPRVAMISPIALFTTSRSINVRWSAVDGVSAVVSADLRYRRIPVTGGSASPWLMWKTATTARSATVTSASLGYRYCFSARARNAAGAVSAWSAPACTTVPVDDRSLRLANSGWTRGSGAGWINATSTSTARRGATLSISSAAPIGRVGVIGLRCSTCGRVAVYVGAARVGTINLAWSGRATRALLMLPRFPVARAGVIRLVVTSTGRTVRVDALALAS